MDLRPSGCESRLKTDLSPAPPPHSNQICHNEIAHVFNTLPYTPKPSCPFPGSRHLPDPALTNDVPEEHDDPRRNHSDTRFHSNSSTQHQALSSLHDGGSERVASELASTVDVAGAAARSDVPYSFDPAYGDYHGVNSNARGKFNSNGSTTSERYSSRFNDLSNLLAGTMWMPDAARIGATAKLSGSEPGEIPRHHSKPSGAGSSSVPSDVSGVYNVRPATTRCSSIPGGPGSGSESRGRRHRDRFSKTESEFSTHVDACTESNASTFGCGISRTPRDGARDYGDHAEMGRRYRGGRDGVVEAKDSTDGSSFSPSFSSSSTNAVDIVDGVTHGSRERRKGRRSGMATSALVGGEGKQKVQKGWVGGGAWGGSHPNHGDRNRGSGKGGRWVKTDSVLRVAAVLFSFVLKVDSTVVGVVWFDRQTRQPHGLLKLSFSLSFGGGGEGRGYL